MSFFFFQKGYESADYKTVRIKLRGEIFYVGLHSLNYWVSKDFANFGKNLDISHLCHLKSCVNPSHLVAETRKMNNDRKVCAKYRHCSGHGDQPNCLI